MSTQSLLPPDPPGINVPPWSLVERYLSGAASATERAQLLEWVAEDSSHEQWLASIATIRAQSPMLPPEKRAGWAALDTDMAWTTLSARIPMAEVRESTVTRSFWRSAVFGVTGLVLVLGIALSGRIGFDRLHAPASMASREYATRAGQRMSIRLSDGTQVTLAPASRLQVGRQYDAGRREVELQGEAYFSVLHDVAHPFAVRSGNTWVRDVGTVFDVRHYLDDGDVRVAVAQGEVAIGKTALFAGDLATVGETGIGIAHKADIAAIMAWRQGELKFKDAPLRIVTRDVGRALDLDITVADSALGAKLLTGTFGIGSVDDVLDAMTRAVGARYERDGRRVVIHRNTGSARPEPSRAAPPLRMTQATLHE